MDEKGNQKLMIVGVDANGVDLINDANRQYIYDFAKSCPDLCDLNSPLFNPKPR